MKGSHCFWGLPSGYHTVLKVQKHILCWEALYGKAWLTQLLCFYHSSYRKFRKKESIISFQLKVYIDEDVINDIMWRKATHKLEWQLLILKADLLVLLGKNVPYSVKGLCSRKQDRKNKVCANDCMCSSRELWVSAMLLRARKPKCHSIIFHLASDTS